MGPAGSGRSQVGFITILLDPSMSTDCSQKIIDTLIGQNSRTGGPGLKFVTNKVFAHRVLGHEKYRDKLVLVDTPAFDNDNKTDKQVLEMISEWLEKTYVGISAHEPE